MQILSLLQIAIVSEGPQGPLQFFFSLDVACSEGYWPTYNIYKRFKVNIKMIPDSPVSKRDKSSDLGDFGAKPENLHTGSVFCAEED